MNGVRSAGASLTWPTGGIGWGNGMRIEGRPAAEPDIPTVSYVIVTPGWFAAAGIPLTGSDVSPRGIGDGHGIVVNQALAKRFFAGADPRGSRIRFADDAPWSTIVGVARDVPPAPGEAVWPTVYPPTTLESLASMALVVRLDGAAASVATAIRSVVHSMDADVVVSDVATMESRLSEALSRPRYTTSIVALFAGIALLLACLGLYGLLAHAVSLRTREMCIRVALGASPRDVVGLVLGQGTRIAAAGIVLGLGAALALGRLVRSLLFDTRASDPLLLGAVALLVLVLALLASWMPARRAAAADPNLGLRAD